MIISEVSCWIRFMYISTTCYFISITQSAVCQVLGHQAVLVLEAVYKHVIVELLASLQQMKY